jgi:hypothetical protein
MTTEGVLQWLRIYEDGGNASQISTLTPTADGGVLAGGLTQKSGVTSGLLLRLTQFGSVTWRKTLQDGNPTQINAIVPSASGTWIAIGSTALAGYAVRINDAGAVQWQRRIRVGTDRWVYANSATAGTNGAVLIAGSSVTPVQLPNNPFDGDGLLLQLNASGSVDWVRSYGTRADPLAVINESLWGITRDASGLMLLGVRAYNQSASSALLLRVSATGELPAGCAATIGETASSTATSAQISAAGLVTVTSQILGATDAYTLSREETSGPYTPQIASTAFGCASETANSAPNADAGPDLTVFANEEVVMQPGPMSDPDGDPVYTTWASIGANAIELPNPHRPALRFVAPNIDGVLNLELVALDLRGRQATDTVNVRVLPNPNGTPVATPSIVTVTPSTLPTLQPETATPPPAPTGTTPPGTATPGTGGIRTPVAPAVTADATRIAAAEATIAPIVTQAWATILSGAIPPPHVYLPIAGR